MSALSACSPKCVIGSGRWMVSSTGVHIGVASYNYALKNSTYRYQNSDTGTPLLNGDLLPVTGFRSEKAGVGVWSFRWERGMLIWIMTVFQHSQRRLCGYAP